MKAGRGGVVSEGFNAGNERGLTGLIVNDYDITVSAKASYEGVRPAVDPSVCQPP